ncbi:MAG: DUF4868 domain-containing protein [Bacteroidales bacterium]|nr:DUF4868 domain-containing protein [Bacteroidales bacterium]
MRKEGVSSKLRAYEKYIFKVYQVDCEDDVRDRLYAGSKSQLESIIAKNYEMVEYDVISDDTNHLFTYPIENKLFSFEDVVTNQLGKVNIPKVSKLSDIQNNAETLWAYCVEFEHEDKRIYTFRKISDSKVGIDGKDVSKIKWCRTFFNTKSLKLELLTSDTINLEKIIDCVFFDGIFYIIRKYDFENIIGLQEEFKNQALAIGKEITSLDMVTGSDVVEKIINEKSSLHRKLIKVKKMGYYEHFTAKDLPKLQKTCRKFGEKLPVKDGKINIETADDLEVVLRMFGDYYKVGINTGQSYATFAGKVVMPQE